MSARRVFAVTVAAAACAASVAAIAPAGPTLPAPAVGVTMTLSASGLRLSYAHPGNAPGGLVTHRLTVRQWVHANAWNWQLYADGRGKGRWVRASHNEYNINLDRMVTAIAGADGVAHFSLRFDTQVPSKRALPGPSTSVALCDSYYSITVQHQPINRRVWRGSATWFNTADGQPPLWAPSALAMWQSRHCGPPDAPPAP